MAAKHKIQRFFQIVRDNAFYIAIGSPSLFFIACVTLILDGKSFLIAMLGALIFILSIGYVASLLVLGVVFFSDDQPTRRKRRRRP